MHRKGARVVRREAARKRTRTRGHLAARPTRWVRHEVAWNEWNSLSITLIGQPIAGGDMLTWVAHPPPGVLTAPASGLLNLAEGARASDRVAISVADDLALGIHSVAFELRAANDNAVSRTATQLNVAHRGTLRWYANNAGCSDDGHPAAANFDGGGWSYSAQALAAAGLSPGALVRWNGFTFTWPDCAPGELDNVAVGGHSIELPAAPSATRLAFLGSATNGDAETAVRINYTDGTTTTALLGLSDWALADDSYAPRFGNEIVAKTVYRNWSSGTQYETSSYVFAAGPISLEPSKQVASVTLPRPTRVGVLHIFAWAVVADPLR
jgi:hypothetical protein